MKVFQSADWQQISQINLTNQNKLWKPVVFDLSMDSDKQAFEKFIAEKPPIEKYLNHLESELRELFKIRHPEHKMSAQDLDEKWRVWGAEHPKQEEYGTYVYYPWSKTLVHNCRREEFIELRTSRNQYKITPEEQRELSTKTVGVIGLSVGQSVALTMAMERLFGTLRIADFDILELTNLNRIRKGTDYIGVPKTVMVAREIAEIDPFLKVELFNEGINDENLADFLGFGQNKLDLLVEECDSLAIKLKARTAARALQIPVLMDTSDRGLIDIERFDLEPERPLLHGLVSENEARGAESLSQKERISLVMKMVGVEKVSSRLKASLLEVEQSITTWPQLASSVVYGGAVCAIIARHILLGRDVNSGRYYFDPESILRLKSEEFKFELPTKPAELSWDELRHKVETENRASDALDWVQPTSEEVEDMVEKACLAPSGGNVQPWKWLNTAHGLYLFHDHHHSFSFLDFKHRGSFIGLGAALENLRQRALHHKYHAHIELRAQEYEAKEIAVVNFAPVENANRDSAFYFGDSLELRLTNRKKYDEYRPIATGLKKKSFELLEDGFDCTWIEDTGKIKEVAHIIGQVERLRVLDPWGHADFIAEARWDKEEAERTRTGVDLRTMDMTESDKVGFRLIKDAQALQMLKQWNRGQGLAKMGSETSEASSAIVLLHARNHSPQTVLQGGMILEKLWLYFNANGVAFQPVSPSTFMFARLGVDKPVGSSFLIDSLSELRKSYLHLFDLPSEVNDLFLFRLFYAGEPKVKSLRKELRDVFYNLNT